MKILGIEHIGIAVHDLEQDAPFWKYILNIPHEGTEVVEGQGVTTDIYNTSRGKIELLEPLGLDSSIARFLAKKGPGFHHVCFEVDDINQAILELNNNDIHLIYQNPVTGSNNSLVTFIHPESTGGVLVELVQKQ